MDRGAWQVTVHGGHKEWNTTERTLGQSFPRFNFKTQQGGTAVLLK